LCAGRKIELDLSLLVQDEASAKRFATATAETCQNLTRLTLFDQLPRDLRSERAAGDALPDDEAAAGLLAALPARAAVGAGVLADRLAAARARAELDALRPQLLLVERGDLFHRLAREALDLAHELRPVALAVLDVRDLL